MGCIPAYSSNSWFLDLFFLSLDSGLDSLDDSWLSYEDQEDPEALEDIEAVAEVPKHKILEIYVVYSYN